MRNFVLSVVASLFVAGPLQAETYKEAFPELTAQLVPEFQERMGQMQLLHGTISLGDGFAQVAVPEGYYFLGPMDARFVIEKVWGNPDDPTLLGLMVPANVTFTGEKDWAITYEFDPVGYVSDADAEGYDYDALLSSMQSDTLNENAERKKQGFPAVTLLGWAEPPHYDKADRKLIWAKRLAFEGSPGETLNYNIRALGRKGVLVVNFIAGMAQLPDVKAAAPLVSKAISFTDGNKYTDFLPNADTVAAVGIGGLIAGKVLSSTGVFALAILFLKKAGIFLIIGVGWLWRKIKSGLGAKSDPGV